MEGWYTYTILNVFALLTLSYAFCQATISAAIFPKNYKPGDNPSKLFLRSVVERVWNLSNKNSGSIRDLPFPNLLNTCSQKSKIEVMNLAKVMFRDLISIILGKSKLNYDEKKKQMEDFVFGQYEYANLFFGEHFASLVQHPREIAVAMRYVGDEIVKTAGYIVSGVPMNADEDVLFSGPVDGDEHLAYPVMFDTRIPFQIMESYAVPKSHLNENWDAHKNFEDFSSALPSRWRVKLRDLFSKSKEISRKKKPSDSDLDLKDEIDLKIFQNLQKAIQESYK